MEKRALQSVPQDEADMITEQIDVDLGSYADVQRRPGQDANRAVALVLSLLPDEAR